MGWERRGRDREKKREKGEDGRLREVGMKRKEDE